MDAKLKKVNAEFIEKNHIVVDDGIKREIGYVDFLKIPAKELIEILENVNIKTLFGRNTNDKFVHCCLADPEDPLYVNNIADHWVYSVKQVLGITKNDVLNLIKAYAKSTNGTKAYEALGKVLSSTVELRYIDWINTDKYDLDIDYFFGTQKDVDHNSVSEYSLLIKKPIPFDIIRTMNKEVKLFKLNDESELSSYGDYLNHKDKKYIKTHDGSIILRKAGDMFNKEEKTDESCEELIK